MNRQNSDINWSDYPCPLPVHIFEKNIQQSINTPIESLGLSETLWSQCRTFAIKLHQQGFIDPIGILYTSFKHYYPSIVTVNAFTRWLLLDPSNRIEFPLNNLRYPIFSSVNDLLKLSSTTNTIDETKLSIDIEQIWFFFSISILFPSNHSLEPDLIVLDNDITRTSVTHKRRPGSRLHCLFAVTPSGKYSNQLYIGKPSRWFQIDVQSNSYARIIPTTTGDLVYEHIQQWLKDFLSSSCCTKNSALVIDPRTTLIMPDFVQLCEQSNVHLISTNVDSYVSNIALPIFRLFMKQWSEVNRIHKMSLTSVGTIRRYIQSVWYALRRLKENDQISDLFKQTNFWKKNDQEYFEYLQQMNMKTILPKKKKKKILIKTNKSKLPATISCEPALDSSSLEDVLLLILNRQYSISRANKQFPGMKFDYLKYCLSYKMPSSYMNPSSLMELNHFMQSTETVQWLRRLHALKFWPCAKQTFLREVYQLTGISTRKRSMNICGNNNNLGSIRNCDEQSPASFWHAFEQLHQIQFDNEFKHQNENDWNEEFQGYLIEKNLNNEKTQLWTVDTFEFPLTKKSTILQLPEWNELRPMNLTPKVTVIYAFSNTGLSTEPMFIFPTTLRNSSIENEKIIYNQLGHLTPRAFLSWTEKSFPQVQSPIVLVCCSRLPIFSSDVLAYLDQHTIYPYGYSSTRTLPFRYLFERRGRNNRSTNLLSELWKKKLLDEQRTHLLKDSLCTVENIKHHFDEIWPILLNEKRDDDDENKTLDDKCQQAFQQANIQIELTHQSSELIRQLDQLVTVVNQIKQQINPTQILKLKSNDNLNGTHDLSIEQKYNSNDKRSNDENSEIRSTKRLRASVQQWIPPSKQFIQHLQTQSTSLFQFILLIINTICLSIDCSLSKEQYQWLYAILDQYDSNHDHAKYQLLIETACLVARKDLVR